jgi:hypothetical protein
VAILENSKPQFYDSSKSSTAVLLIALVIIAGQVGFPIEEKKIVAAANLSNSSEPPESFCGEPHQSPEKM